MRLFREQGYYDTTVEQIAEAAEISPSTFFRYFPTKESVVLEDDLDPVIIEQFHRQPMELSPIQSLREALKSSLFVLSDTELRLSKERKELIMSVPELRAAMLNHSFSMTHMLAGVIAERVGRPSNDFQVRNIAGAIMSAVISTEAYCSDNPAADYFSVFDKALAHLEAGLPLT